MFRKIATITLTFAAMFNSISAQNTWSLERCIQYARKNSLTIKQAQYDVRNAELTLKGAQLERLPNVNGNFSSSWNLGKNIDPTTNTFVNTRLFGGNGSVTGSLLIFDGNRINTAIKQSKTDLRAFKLEADAQANDISLQIAQAYLAILLAQEQLDNAQAQLELSQEQLDQIDKQIRAGTVPENDRLDFLAQIARNRQTIVEASNQVEINYLRLKNLMEIDPSTDFEIQGLETVEIPEDANPGIYQTPEVYQAALQTQPQIEAGQLRLESAELSARLARSNIFPRLSVFGQLNTNYSNQQLDLADIPTEIVPSDPAPVLIDGTPADIAFFREQPVTQPPIMPFFKQVKNNFGQAFGFSLQVPIYNNHQNIISVERARISALNQEVVNRQLRQQLKTDVQTAVTNAKASERSLDAAQRSLEAAQAAFDNAQNRFELGAINSLEYTTARNNLDQAQVLLIQAKYQYLFDLKVVDFYLGRELTLD